MSDEYAGFLNESMAFEFGKPVDDEHDDDDDEDDEDDDEDDILFSV
jgi:hypothetical protein